MPNITAMPYDPMNWEKWAFNGPEMKDAQSRGERLGVGASALDAGREAGISGCIFG